MQAKMSYTKIGLFSLASYPYRQAPALGSAAAEQGSDGCCLGRPWCYCCCRFVFKICPPAVELATHRRACMCRQRYAADAPPRLPCRSFKLLWSPIVDSVYWPAVGRRRSWILPLQVGCFQACRLGPGREHAGRLWSAGQVVRCTATVPLSHSQCRLVPARPPRCCTSCALAPCPVLQTCSAALMLSCGGWVEAQLEAGNAAGVTSLFFCLVLLAATQDIAVDGWALTLLSKQHVG